MFVHVSAILEIVWREKQGERGRKEGEGNEGGSGEGGREWGRREGEGKEGGSGEVSRGGPTLVMSYESTRDPSTLEASDVQKSFLKHN